MTPTDWLVRNGQVAGVYIGNIFRVSFLMEFSTAWNKEVLWVGGFLARIIYEEEMRIAKFKDELATQLHIRLWLGLLYHLRTGSVCFSISVQSLVADDVSYRCS